MEQARGERTREKILSAAVTILTSQGLTKLTHRNVAALADASLGSIRYHFANRDELIRACLGSLEEQRDAQARKCLANIASWEDLSAADVGDAALLILYGPLVDDESLVNTLGWLVDCMREGNRFAPIMQTMREAMDSQLNDLLERTPYSNASVSLVGALIEGVIFQSVIEGRTNIRDRVVSRVSSLLKK